MQAARLHSALFGNGKQRRSIAIRFFPDTANDPSVVYDPNDDVASVVHTSTGLFTVTLNYPVKRVLMADAQIQLATVGTDRKAVIGPIANEGTASALTVQVAVLAVAAVTDIAANANNSIMLQLELELA